jgi:hypothetical protein
MFQVTYVSDEKPGQGGFLPAPDPAGRSPALLGQEHVGERLGGFRKLSQ